MQSIITRPIFAALLLLHLGNHSSIHSAAENTSHENLLPSDPEKTVPQYILDRALCLDAFHGNAEKVQHALESGANPNTVYEKKSYNNILLRYFYSCSFDHSNFFTRLFKLDPSKNCVMCDNLFIIPFFLFYIMTIVVTYSPPLPLRYIYTTITCGIWSALHYRKAINCMAEHETDSQHRTRYSIKNKTPLMIVAQLKKSKQPDHNHIIQLLLQHKAHVHDADKNGNNALTFATKNNNADAATLLCLAGANTSNVYQTASFHHAEPAVKNIIQGVERSKYLLSLLTQHLRVPSPLASLILRYDLPALNLASNVHDQDTLTEKFITYLENNNKQVDLTYAITHLKHNTL